MEPLQGTVMTDLPDAVLLWIFRQLPPKSVIRIQVLNRRLSSLAKDPTVWGPICQERARAVMPEEFLDRVDWVHKHMAANRVAVVQYPHSSNDVEVKPTVLFKTIGKVGMCVRNVPMLRKSREYAQFRANIGGWLADRGSVAVHYFAEVLIALQLDHLQGMGRDEAQERRSELQFLLDMHLTPHEGVCSSIIRRLEMEQHRLDLSIG